MSEEPIASIPLIPHQHHQHNLPTRNQARRPFRAAHTRSKNADLVLTNPNLQTYNLKGYSFQPRRLPVLRAFLCALHCVGRFFFVF